jgi:hypothetical protein
MAKAKRTAPKSKGKPSEYERLVTAKGNERKTRTVDSDLGVDTDKKVVKKVTTSAKADFEAMQAKEGDPFASKRGRQVDMSPYKPTKRDIEKGVVEDPNVFKGDDAPYGRATSKQRGAFREANAKVKASQAVGDRDGAEKARAKMNKLGQFPGAADVEHRCFGSNCTNDVKPSESVLCPNCESRDSTKVQIGTVSGAAASRSRTREQKSA